jgi:N-acetylglucosaminyldiphosphoundecaprenol N-acetyl-beta-D-mannosaminyltransferase
LAVDFTRDVYCLLGLSFDAVTMSEAVNRVRRAVSNRKRCLLSTPNISFVISCLSDREFRDSVVNSDLSIADGMPLVWMARLLGLPIRERVTGSGLFETLRGDTTGRMSVYFFGGPEGVAERACRRLNEENSGLNCVGHECPGFGPIADMSAESAIARINASGADFLVVALGAKKGQAWIMHNHPRITVPVISHLGAVVNFVAGTVRRAPAWMQRSGLEWLWRIREEPGLFRRYFRDGMVLLSLLVTRAVPCAWYLRRNKPDARQVASASMEILEQGHSCVVRLRGAWTRENIAPLRDGFSRVALSGKDAILEMEEVTHADNAFVGLVQLLHGHLAQNGRRLSLTSLQPSVRRVIAYCCAEYLTGTR